MNFFLITTRQLIKWSVYGLILSLILFSTNMSLADSTGIDYIQNVPNFDSKEINFSKAIERKFALTGTLNAIYKNRIVVGDTSLPLQSNVKVSGIQPGEHVGVQLNERGKVQLIMQLQHPE